jgi:hypothetical protein
MLASCKRWPVWLAPWLALLAAGCGGNVVVKGTLQKDGKPYVVTEGEQLEVTFVGQDASGRPFSSAADVDPADATMVFKGPTGNGVPPGTYKIAVSSRQFAGPKQSGDRFEDAFSVDRTPLTYTVTTSSNQDIIIDVVQKKAFQK